MTMNRHLWRSALLATMLLAGIAGTPDLSHNTGRHAMKQMQKHLHSIIGTAMLALTISSAHGAPGDVTISWADEEAGSATPNPGNELGAPDNQITAISDFHYVWVRNFRPPVTYNGLGALLGVARTALARANVIAFEFNGGNPASGGGWESSTWFFSDLQRAYAEIFDEGTGRGTIRGGRRARFLTGSISGDAYTAFFCQPDPSVCPPADPVISWILIDAPNDIDVHSPNFSIWVSGALIREGTPDVDAIGVIEILE